MANTRVNIYFIRLLTIVGAIILSVTIIYHIGWLGKPIQPNGKAITTAIDDLLDKPQTMVCQWLESNADSMALRQIWESDFTTTSNEKGVSLYLFRGDTMVYWCNNIYKGDIDHKLLNPEPTLTLLDGNKVLIFTHKRDNLAGSIVVNLHNTIWQFNSNIFKNNQIILHPYSPRSEFNNKYNVSISIDQTRFIVEPIPSLKSPTIITVLGWIGILMITLTLCYYARVISSQQNIFKISILLLILLTLIRTFILIFNIPDHTGELFGQIFTEHGEVLFSIGNLLVSFVFILIYCTFIYKSRYKIKWYIKNISRRKQLFMLILSLLIINLTLVYFHYTMVNVIYNSPVNIKLYNIFNININSIIFYVICALFVATRMIMNKLIYMGFKMFSFWTKLSLSLVILIAILIPIESSIINTGYILVIFHVAYLSISSIKDKIGDNIIFMLCLVVFSSYITLFSTIESFSAYNQDTEQYTKYILQKSKYTNSNDIVFNNASYSIQNEQRFQEFSYTRITKTKLETKEDNSLNIQDVIPLIISGRDTTVLQNGQRHSIYHNINDSTVIISRRVNSPLSIIALFVYMFIFLYVVSGIILRISGFDIGTTMGWSQLALRIRGAILGVVLFSMLSITIIIIKYSFENYNGQQSKILNNNVRNLTRSFNLYAEYYSSNADDILQKWYKYAGVSFDYNLNIYDINGNLITGSTLYPSTAKINCEAYKAMYWNHAPYYKQHVDNSTNNRLSSFLPMFYRNQPVGYLNLIYYDDVNSSSNQLFSLLSQITNVFVIILFMAILLSALLYRKITTPLNRLHDALSNVAQMQKIPQKETQDISDEVGLLVAQYNRMIDYLEESYAQLAKSEREGAWREMARQIAHDIKNPLTPMKLKIQMLQRAKAINDPNLGERLDSTLKVLLEQIDLLADIASEFSDFARLSEGKLTNLDICNMLNNIVNLYSNYDNIEVKFTADTTQMFVRADYQQLSRVIINLCQNAIQAIGNNNFGLIYIKATKENKVIRLEITDNGSGIAMDIREKIFQPNFTTKRSGSGLGLAICNQIIHSLGGTITFDTILGEGTTFIIELPEVNQVNKTT